MADGAGPRPPSPSGVPPRGEPPASASAARDASAAIRAEPGAVGWSARPGARSRRTRGRRPDRARPRVACRRRASGRPADGSAGSERPGATRLGPSSSSRSIREERRRRDATRRDRRRAIGRPDGRVPHPAVAAPSGGSPMMAACWTIATSTSSPRCRRTREPRTPMSRRGSGCRPRRSTTGSASWSRAA